MARDAKPARGKADHDAVRTNDHDAVRMNLDDYPAIMGLDDYCAYYGISRATGRRWLAEGRATRVPGHRYIKILRESVRRYDESLLKEPPH